MKRTVNSWRARNAVWIATGLVASCCAASPAAARYTPPHYAQITKAALTYYEDDTAHNRTLAKRALAKYGPSAFVLVQQTLNPKWEKAEALAFVLADFGVDVCANVKRLAANWGTPQKGFAEELVATVVRDLHDIFLHTGKACAWRTFLAIPCDGSVCDESVPDAVEVLTKCPLHALVIAGESRASAAALADLVSTAPLDTSDREARAVLGALRRYRKYGNPHVRLAAKMCIEYIHKYRIFWQNGAETAASGHPNGLPTQATVVSTFVPSFSTCLRRLHRPHLRIRCSIWVLFG